MPEQLGAFQRDIEQGAFPGGLVVRHRGLVQMAEVVEFVAEPGVVQPALLVDPWVRR